MDVHKKFTFDDPEDSYWNQNSSTASASLFFNDGINSDEARQALDMLGEAQEQFKKINFDDVSSITDSEKQFSESDFGAKISMTSTPNRRPDSSRIQFNESVSSFNDFKLNGKNKMSTASIVSEGSLGSFNSEFTVNLDYSRLKSEHKKLQKYLERVRAEKYRASPINETIKRLRNCEPVSLDFYRSKDDKVQLLDAAIETLDRDVITRIVLFLKSTLIISTFREILLFRSEAADAYIQYLKEAKEYDELIELLYALGKGDRAAMFELMLACNKRQPEAKLQFVKKCLISGFSDPSLMKEAGYVRDYIDLLDRKVIR